MEGDVSCCLNTMVLDLERLPVRLRLYMNSLFCGIVEALAMFSRACSCESCGRDLRP